MGKPSKTGEVPVIPDEHFLGTLMENLPDLIFFKDLELRFVLFSRSTAEHARLNMLNAHHARKPQTSRGTIPDYLISTEACAAYLVGKTDRDIFSDERARRSQNDEQQIIRTGEPILNNLKQTTETNGEVCWRITTRMPWRDEAGKMIGVFGISRDVTAQKQAESQLEIANRRLIDDARLVGQSEVAIGVIHNLGNILTSAKVSCTLSLDKAKASSATKLTKVVDLMKQRRENLGEFITTDPRGREIPGYLAQLATRLRDEQGDLLKELQSLRAHINDVESFMSFQKDHIIVTQDSTQNRLEEVSLAHLAEAALRLDELALKANRIEVQREFETGANCRTDRFAALNVLQNLIRNARRSFVAEKSAKKLLRIKIGPADGERAAIQIIHSPSQIPQETLAHIFSQGLTGEPNLHSSAVVINNLGGSISVANMEAEQATAFTVFLPVTPRTLSKP